MLTHHIDSMEKNNVTSVQETWFQEPYIYIYKEKDYIKYKQKHADDTRIIRLAKNNTSNNIVQKSIRLHL